MKFPKGSYACDGPGGSAVQVVGIPVEKGWPRDSIDTWQFGRCVLSLDLLTGEARELAEALLAEKKR